MAPLRVLLSARLSNLLIFAPVALLPVLSSVAFSHDDGQHSASFGTGGSSAQSTELGCLLTDAAGGGVSQASSEQAAHGRCLLAHAPQSIRIAGIHASEAPDEGAEAAANTAAATVEASSSRSSEAAAAGASLGMAGTAAMAAAAESAAWIVAPDPALVLASVSSVVSAVSAHDAEQTPQGAQNAPAPIVVSPIVDVGGEGGMVTEGPITTSAPDENVVHASINWLKKQKKKIPMSVPLWCVVALSVQPLLIYTLLTVVRNTDVVYHGSLELSWYSQLFSSAFDTSASAPALSALFLACGSYMQCIGSMGKGIILDMQGCVLVVTIVASLQFLCVLGLPITAHREGKPAYFVTLSGQQCEVAASLQQRILWLQVLLFICFYGGLLMIVVHTVQLMEASFPIAGPCALPLVTTGLLTLYFVVHFLLWCARHAATSRQWVVNALLKAGARVYKIPMVSVLLIAAQMQMGKGTREQDVVIPFFGGTEQQWLDRGSSVLLAALVMEVLVSAIRGMFKTSDSAPISLEMLGDDRAIERSHSVEKIQATTLTVVQYVFDAIGYASLFAIVIAAFLHSGAGFPPPSIRAALTLAFIFFTVRVGEHVVLWGLAILTDVQGSLHAVVQAASVGVKVCPHICVLFLVCQLRAEEVQADAEDGNPQWWAEDAMLLCVSGVCLQQLCCLTLPAYTGAPAAVEEDGTAIFDRRPFLGAYVVSLVKYTALLCMHTGLQMVCVSIFAITPATAHIIRAARPLMPLIGMVLVFALVAACLSSVKVISSIVKFTLESVDKNVLGPHLGVSVRVQKVWLNIFSGYVNIGGITVTSPPIPELIVPQVLKVERIVAVINRGRLLKTRFRECEIESLTMKGVDVTFETMPSFKGEISAMMARFEETFQNTIVTATSSSSSSSSSAESKKHGPGQMRYIIHELAVRGITTEVKSPPMRMELRDIVYGDFHTQCHRPMSLMDDVFRSVVLALLRHVALKSRGMWYGVVDCSRSVATGVTSYIKSTCGAIRPCGSPPQL